MKEPDSDSKEVLGEKAASSRHYAEGRVRGKQVEEMYGKDIRNSEEVKSVSEKCKDDGREQRDSQTRH